MSALKIAIHTHSVWLPTPASFRNKYSAITSLVPKAYANGLRGLVPAGVPAAVVRGDRDASRFVKDFRGEGVKSTQS